MTVKLRKGRWLAEWGIPEWIIPRKRIARLEQANAALMRANESLQEAIAARQGITLPLPWYTVHCWCGNTSQTRFKWAVERGKCRECVAKEGAVK